MTSYTQDTLKQRLTAVRRRIERALQLAGRDQTSLQLLAVSKNHGVEAMEQAYACDQRLFGESYVQEAVKKMDALAQLTDIQWHFIGPIQSNKTQIIATRFHWVHSVDRLKIARRLNDQRPSEMAPLNVCIQVNISGETSKSGVTTEQVQALCHEMASMPNLQLRGLMAIPQRSEDEVQQRRVFRQIWQLQQDLNSRLGLELDTLSMGMSGDLEAAILEGATIVRVGSDIFGPREG